MSPESRVRAFCEAFARRDPRELLGFLAPDCVYHNIPMAPLHGHAAIEPVLAAFLRGTTRVEFEILALASAGASVLTERVDRFEREDGRRIELPVMGAFEVGADGRITAWRDYFDLGMWTRQAGG
jgi:limonene-1,2-epoxide hydrolase